MYRIPSILTSMAFRQSQRWQNSATSICRVDESPEDLGSLQQAIRLLKNQAQFDTVVTMGSRPSLVYGILCGILRLPSKQIMTEVFLDEPNPRSLGWQIKTALFRWIAKRSLGVLTNSSAEVEFIARRFEIPQTKLRFVPMYTTIEHPEISPPINEGYVLSIGRTLRDLDALLQAASHFQCPLVLVIGKHDRLPKRIPSNVQVLRDISLAESHEKLRRAAVVVIPLLPVERSTGQVVLFEAMAMGKPVVATRVTGTQDYIRDGENGLLVEPGDAEGLAGAVQSLLCDTNYSRRVATQALADCQAQWMPNHHATRKLDAIAQLWISSNPTPGKSHA